MRSTALTSSSYQRARLTRPILTHLRHSWTAMAWLRWSPESANTPRNRGSLQSTGYTWDITRDFKKEDRLRTQRANSGFTSARTNITDGRSTNDKFINTTWEAPFTRTFAGGKLWTSLAKPCSSQFSAMRLP